MYAIMIFSASWQLLLLQIFIILLDITVQGGDVENKTADIEIPPLTVEHILYCLNGVNSTWKKNGKTISVNSNALSLSCIDKSSEGKYTCHAHENSVSLKEITVTVKETSNGEGWCGKPVLDEPFCQSSWQKDYPCCKDIPNPAKKMSIKTSNSSIRPSQYCTLYSGPNKQKNPFDALIEWEEKSFGTYNTWGWMVKSVGLEGHAGSKYCAQINSKETKNWTIPANNFVPGAKYNITLQTLPESKSGQSNSIFKIFEVPSLQGMCRAIGHSCNWEFCFPVENLTVTNYSSSPVVSWRPSPFYKSEHAFEVKYYYESRSYWKEVIVKDGLYNLTLTNLKRNLSGQHFVEVRPLFREANVDDSEIIEGISKKLMFYTAVPEAPNPSNDTLKITIAVSVAVICLCIFIILLQTYRRLKKSHRWRRKNLFTPIIVPIIPEVPVRPIDVFLVHDGHCNLCKNFAHSLANVFWETGHINCYLDLCSTNKISELGMRWYEQQFSKCNKIVVICTKQSKNTYENLNEEGSSNNIHRRSFRLVLSMILGQLSHNKQVFPVYLDASSREDIPNFLRDRQPYQLPSDIEQLLMSASDLDARQLGVAAEFQLESTTELQNKIRQCKNAAIKLEQEHRCRDNETVCSINYGRSSSYSSTDEPVRV